ncbi:MAG: hypothetical protein HQM12_12780 [SAR324 cluster bacterium]|nr:hypothetical protein [SAR324 cluster bacterium]
MLKSVLVLEESSTIQGLVASALKESQLTIHQEQQSEKFLARTKQVVPDLILLSNSEQQRNYSTCKQLLKEQKLSRIPVILMVNARDTIEEKNLKDLGIRNYIRKPFEASILQDQIKHYIPSAFLMPSAMEFQNALSFEERHDAEEDFSVFDDEMIDLIKAGNLSESPEISDENVPDVDFSDELSPQDEDILETEDIDDEDVPDFVEAEQTNNDLLELSEVDSNLESVELGDLEDLDGQTMVVHGASFSDQDAQELLSMEDDDTVPDLTDSLSADEDFMEDQVDSDDSEQNDALMLDEEEATDSWGKDSGEDVLELDLDMEESIETELLLDEEHFDEVEETEELELDEEQEEDLLLMEEELSEEGSFDQEDKAADVVDFQTMKNKRTAMDSVLLALPEDMEGSTNEPLLIDEEISSEPAREETAQEWSVEDQLVRQQLNAETDDGFSLSAELDLDDLDVNFDEENENSDEEIHVTLKDTHDENHFEEDQEEEDEDEDIDHHLQKISSQTLSDDNELDVSLEDSEHEDRLDVSAFETSEEEAFEEPEEDLEEIPVFDEDNDAFEESDSVDFGDDAMLDEEEQLLDTSLAVDESDMDATTDLSSMLEDDIEPLKVSTAPDEQQLREGLDDISLLVNDFEDDLGLGYDAPGIQTLRDGLEDIKIESAKSDAAEDNEDMDDFESPDDTKDISAYDNVMISSANSDVTEIDALMMGDDETEPYSVDLEDDSAELDFDLPEEEIKDSNFMEDASFSEEEEEIDDLTLESELSLDEPLDAMSDELMDEDEETLALGPVNDNTYEGDISSDELEASDEAFLDEASMEADAFEEEDELDEMLLSDDSEEEDELDEMLLSDDSEEEDTLEDEMLLTDDSDSVDGLDDALEYETELTDSEDATELSFEEPSENEDVEALTKSDVFEQELLESDDEPSLSSAQIADMERQTMSELEELDQEMSTLEMNEYDVEIDIEDDEVALDDNVSSFHDELDSSEEIEETEPEEEFASFHDELDTADSWEDPNSTAAAASFDNEVDLDAEDSLGDVFTDDAGESSVMGEPETVEAFSEVVQEEVGDFSDSSATLVMDDDSEYQDIEEQGEITLRVNDTVMDRGLHHSGNLEKVFEEMISHSVQKALENAIPHIVKKLVQELRADE